MAYAYIEYSKWDELTSAFVAAKLMLQTARCYCTRQWNLISECCCRRRRRRHSCDANVFIYGSASNGVLPGRQRRRLWQSGAKSDCSIHYSFTNFYSFTSAVGYLAAAVPDAKTCVIAQDRFITVIYVNPQTSHHCFFLFVQKAVFRAWKSMKMKRRIKTHRHVVAILRSPTYTLISQTNGAWNVPSAD